MGKHAQLRASLALKSEKFIGSILGMRVTIPGTHGMFFNSYIYQDFQKKSSLLFVLPRLAHISIYFLNACYIMM
jgi:hypothetical protein